MGLCQHTLAAWNPLFSNCFEVRVVLSTLISDINADLGFHVQIAMAFLISFFAKALSATGYFCYASLSGSTPLFQSSLKGSPCSHLSVRLLQPRLESVGLASFSLFAALLTDASSCFHCASVMILPGYVLLTATLELASKVMVPGSIRLVFGVLLSLFLGTGISLGSKLYVCEY